MEKWHAPNAVSRRSRRSRGPGIAGVTLTLLVLAVLLGVAGIDKPVRTSPVAEQRGSPVQEATRAVDRYVGGMSGTSVGVAVLDRRTGEFAGNAHVARPYNSASVVKPIVAIDLLQRRAEGMPVAPSDLRLLREALHTSDDEAMNDLWDRFDGVGAVVRTSQRLGLADTGPPLDPVWWGETQVSARDMVGVFQHILNDMPQPDREFVMTSLRSAPPVADGGFRQDYGLAWIGAENPAVKAGWMCCRDGYVTLHSVGVLGADQRYVIALLSTQPGHIGYEEAKAVLTRSAQLLTTELP